MTSFRNKRDTLANWETNNPRLGPGVIAVIEETGYFKLGNGVSRFMELPSFLPDTDIEMLIQEYVDGLPTGEVTQQDLDDHIHSTNPHPQYDSGLDLKVLYDNVKAG